ncbi:MAG: hypothetical protein IH849_01340 [Acidobacteria bacterium]|nr:hypothetical protein [Acidobacteriota bacterium]
MHRSVKVQGNPAQHKEVGPMSYRRVSQIALVVLTGVLIACGGDQAVSPTQPDLGGLASLTGEAKGGKGGGGGGGSSLSTCDTFASAPTDPTGVKGDGGGDSYCDGVDRVKSAIGRKGAHSLDTNRSTRVLEFDFSGTCVPKDGTSCTRPAGFTGANGDQLSTKVSMGVWLVDGPGNLKEMTFGETIDDGVTINIRSNWNGTKHGLQLHFGYGGTPGLCTSNGDRLNVTRVSETEWRFDNVGANGACLTEIVNNDWANPVGHGVYSMPLSFIVTVKP